LVSEYWGVSFKQGHVKINFTIQDNNKTISFYDVILKKDHALNFYLLFARVTVVVFFSHAQARMVFFRIFAAIDL